MSLQTYVHGLLSTDVVMPTLGMDADAWRRTAPVDAPSDRLFAILRWGPETPGPGWDTNSHPHDLSIWVYDREPNYARVTAVLNRAKAVLLAVRGVRHSAIPEGWVTQVSWLGRSADLDDDVYKAVTRNDSYRIIAS